ncbi:gem-associated protein 5 isoform X3 [Aphis gossypii]|uniref:gem-associated protein 5 isoform X3 n=1 Tax=Aphis gossypii TaxID=80765 RepID=UPI00100F69BD|nr:gem-associated protein 5 isoform X3 [Aphis gossypii]
MNTFEITQSMNWYKSNIMTMDDSGNLIAYGSRSIVVLVNGLEGNSIYDLKYNRLRLNTKMGCGRIGAVAFSPKTDYFENAHYLASIDEVNIYIWKVKSMVCDLIHSFGNKKNKNITLLDVTWLYGCLTVVALSDAGTLHKWDIQALTMRNYTLDVKTTPLTLAACPHKKNLIAIGCKNGHLFVYDLTGDGQLLHKLHYHERNINSVAWCPVPYSPFSSDQSTEPLLLASIACDRTGLCISRAGLDMFNETTVAIPMRPLRKTAFRNKNNLIWSCVKWIKPTILIVTSGFGEILKVEIKPDMISEPIVTLISDTHKDIIFSIACSRELVKPYLWSSCMGRKLIRTRLLNTKEETSELPLEVPTLGGFVYCFSLSPVNSADFAFGLGDGRIYYWNVSNKRQLELITLSQTMDSKVLSLAFHPQDEGLLAYGTGDGRVGVFNLTRKKNNVNLLKTVLANPIYRLCWAPFPNTKTVDDAKLALYAVGNGQIIIYNDMNLWKDPFNMKEFTQFNEIEDKLSTPVKRIEMAWKPNYDVVAIGNSNGSIYLLDGNTLKLKYVVSGHDQSVECIIWHPTHVTSDYSEESKYKNYFASSSHCIRVHQFNEDCEPSLVVEFKGHKEKINELAWSPHHNLILLSCSNDFTAKVWNVEKCTLIGVYSKHLCTVLCGIFSPCDADIVFTGSADHSIHSWRLSKDLHNYTTEFKKNQDTPNIVKEKIVTKVTDNSKTGTTESSKEHSNKIQQFPLSSYELFIGKHLEKAVDKFIDSKYNNNVSVDEEINYLAFFGTTTEIKKFLADEYCALQKKSSNQMIPCMNNINIWGQNLESYFKDAIATKTINDWMIAVAPSVSYELWTKMCDVYAGQLEDVGEVTKASTYLVAIKKINEAAMLLLKNNLFREALAVVKSQSEQNDELILEITKKWAEYNVLHGHPKEATHCYLSIGDVRNAISCLIKVKQTKELSLAAKLARYIDEDMEESLVVNLLKTEYFRHHKWNEAKELLKNHPKLNYLNMWTSVHKAMFELDPKVTHKIFRNWICAISDEENSSILNYILENVEYKPDYYDKLLKIVGSEFISDASLLMPMITVFLAGQLCLIALQYQATGLFTIDSQKRLIKCFALAYNYETLYTDSNSKFNKILSRLILWIFPKGPLTLDSYTNFEFNDDLIRSIRAYLCYTCFSWLKPLYTSVKKKLNLPVDEDFTDKEKYFSEVIILTQQFQQLFNKYIHDVMDKETLNYFKAKKEIERINQLLTTSSFKTNTDVVINDESIGCVKSIKSDEENESTEIIDNEVIITSKANDIKSLTENIKECNINNSTNFNELCTVNKNKIKFEKEINQFYQNIKSEIEKFNNFNDQSSIKHIAHLEIEASKKKELEQIVAEFESKRINSPDPFSFIAELKTFIHDFVDFDNFKCDH